MSELNGGKVAAKIRDVMSKIHGVNKTGFNAFHKYNFVEAARISMIVREKMVESGLAMFPEMVDYGRDADMTTVTMRYTVVDTDSGDKMTVVTVGQGQDKGDKGSSKAMTSCLKYALIQLFLLPTGDDVEADLETDRTAEAPKAAKPDAAKTKSSKPFDDIVDLLKPLKLGPVEAGRVIAWLTGVSSRDELETSHVDKVREFMSKKDAAQRVKEMLQ